MIKNDLKKVGRSCSRMSSAIFRTGLRAPHVVLAGALVPVGTVLVTPALDEQIGEVLLMSIINVFYCKCAVSQHLP